MSSPKGIVLMEVLVSMVILSIAMIPLLGYFWKLNPKTNDLFEIDRRVEIQLRLHIYDEEHINQTVIDSTYGGASIEIRLEWDRRDKAYCLKGLAYKKQQEVTHLIRCVPNAD